MLTSLPKASIKPARINDLGQISLPNAIGLALSEDLGSGDITSLSVIPPNKVVTASVLVKQKAVIAGLEVFVEVFRQVDPEVKVQLVLQDGDSVESPPQCCARLEGNARSILAGERTALNFLQRLSGIATHTRKFVDLASPFGIAVKDTRKTTPGLRLFEKAAVLAGGGVNHRFDLSAAILIKDNHVLLAGGVRQAIRQARVNQPGKLIEVETTTLEEVRQAVNESVDAILLDNMYPEMVKEAVAIISGKCQIEVSGGVNLQNIGRYLIDGVDAISIGALTHSIASIDISLEIEH